MQNPLVLIETLTRQNSDLVLRNHELSLMIDLLQLQVQHYQCLLEIKRHSEDDQTNFDRLMKRKL